MTERKPGIYDFDVINSRIEELRKEQEEMKKQQEQTEVQVPNPSMEQPNYDDFAYCRDAFKMENMGLRVLANGDIQHISIGRRVDVNGLKYPTYIQRVAWA